MAQSPDNLPWNPNNTTFPSRKQLPKSPNTPEDAAWVWGSDDQLGRINLLTPARVSAAAASIKTGDIIPVNMSPSLPNPPIFHRQPFAHTIKALRPDRVYDDIYTLNTQSSTQLDGLRHCSHLATGFFYNGATSKDFVGPEANTHKCSMHHWAEHGIAGRGVLLDYWAYAQKGGQSALYDPHAYHVITLADIKACAQDQGIDLRPASQGGDMHVGDILFMRIGFTAAYLDKSPEQRTDLAARERPDETYAGVSQEEDMIDWLHDCYFSAVMGDSPAFEAWPSRAGHLLHEHLIALWGMPIGEMLDLEKLATRCRDVGRWTFFFTAAPFNVAGGVASLVNGTAIL